MVIVLVSNFFLFPGFLSCITGLDVLGNIIVFDGTDGWSCVQEYPVLVNDIFGWCLLCGLGHGESHL